MMTKDTSPIQESIWGMTLQMELVWKVSVWCQVVFETGSHSVVLTGLEFTM